MINRSLRTHLLFTSAIATSVFLTTIACADGSDLAEQLRRPVAIELFEDANLLYVANQRSGTVSVIDIAKRRVVTETKIGGRLSHLTASRDVMLATDEESHELLVLAVDGANVSVRQRLKVNQYPVHVVASKGGERAYVSSLWSRRLTFIDLPAGEHAEARVTGQLDLPFAPRVQLLAEDDSRLIVADSFSGRLGVVDCATKKLINVRVFPSHNIRGLGISHDGDMLLVSHQMLNELAHTVSNDIHWGLLMSNDLRWLNLNSVLHGADDLYKGAHMHPIGEAGRGGGDPGGLAVASDGTVVVTIAGTDEMSFGKENDFSLFRLGLNAVKPAERVGRASKSESGPDDPPKRDEEYDENVETDEYGVAIGSSRRRRPTAVRVSRDSRWAYVANTFSDSVSIVDLKQREVTAEVSLGPLPELTPVDRGELLFFDARLSHDGWMSCHSCHTNGHTNGLLNDNFSDQSFGAPKRVLSLLGVAETTPFAWNAGAKNYDEQIRKSITETMQSEQPPGDRQVAALTAFLETLPPPPPIDLARGNRDEAAVARGREFFKAQKCGTCHTPPTYTSPYTYDVGLSDKLGNERFNPPSLVGVGQRDPYFHDGRAKSLEEVFRQYQHKVTKDLPDDQLQDLLSFLRSL